MTNDLKRVGLIFTAEGAVDFKKTLQDVNIEVNKNYNQFKLVQAQWDKSTTSVQKLAAEQQYLQNAYEIQADKVNILRMQLSELENAENKNATAIKKKRSELTNAEAKLATYKTRLADIESQLNNTGKIIEEFGEKVEKVGGKIEDAGKKTSAFSAMTATAFVASAKTAIDFETAVTGVEKTVDATEEQMAELKQGIRDMAKEIPASTTEISSIAEAAGQLGIKTEDILFFTEVMIDLGNSTNLSAEEAASSLAKFANVTKMSADDYDKLGSVIVALGNNFATTEADIVDMATNLAATGELTGLTQSQIMALATAMSSVGIEAEAGGSAMSKLLKKIQVACETGGDDLKDFSKVANMSSKDFKTAFEKDAVGALSAFLDGLNDTERNGKSAISILDDMGLTEVRLSNTILSLSNASDVMNEAVKIGNEAWEDNTALTNEANKRYETLASKITIALNKGKDFALTFGNKLTSVLDKAIDKFDDLTKWVENLTDEQVEFILKTGATVIALGPLLTIIGKVTTTGGKAIKMFGTFTQAIGVATGNVTTTSVAVTKLAGVFTFLASPVGVATVAITTLIGVMAAHEIAVANERNSLGGLREEIDNQVDSWNSLIDARNASLDTNLNEVENCEKLVAELEKITDENGKVKSGYENRAQYILTTLNNALGTEYSLNGDIINQYQDLKDNIDKVIASKKAEVVLSAYQEEYASALKNQSEATQTLIELKEQLNDINDKIATSTGRERAEYEIQRNAIVNGLTEQTTLIQNYGKTISDFENLQKASAEGSAEAIEKAVDSMCSSYNELSSASDSSIENQILNQYKYVKTLKETLSEAKKNNDSYQASILENQVESSEEQLQNLINSLTSQTSTIENLTDDQVNAYKNLATLSKTEYSIILSQMPEETRKKIEESTGIVSSDINLKNATINLADNTVNAFDAHMQNMANVIADELSSNSNIINNDTSVQNAAGELANRAEQSVRSNNSEAWGEDMVIGVGNGIKRQSMSSWFTNTLNGLAGKIASYIHFSRPDVGPLHDYEEWMPDMIEGLGNTLDKSSPKLVNKVKNLSGEMADELQNIDGNIKTNVSSSINYEKIGQSIINSINTSDLIDYDKLTNCFVTAISKLGLYIDKNTLVGNIAPEMNQAMGSAKIKDEREW